jgi:hypothetical protein
MMNRLWKKGEHLNLSGESGDLQWLCEVAQTSSLLRSKCRLGNLRYFETVAVLKKKKARRVHRAFANTGLM